MSLNSDSTIVQYFRPKRGPIKAEGNKVAQTTPSRYRDAFCDRVKAAREAVELTQEQMAHALDTTQGTYKQYETRSLMPHPLLVQFCRITGVHPWYMLTGQPPHLSPTGAAPRSKVS